jgi:hypothetical protein
MSVSSRRGQVTSTTTAGEVSGSDGYSYDGGDNPTTYVNNQSQTFDAADQLQRSVVPGGGGSGGGGSVGSNDAVGATPTAPSQVSGSGASHTNAGPSRTNVSVAAIARTHRLGRDRTLQVPLTTKQAVDLLVAMVSAQGAAGQANTRPSTRGITWTW